MFGGVWLGWLATGAMLGSSKHWAIRWACGNACA